MSEKESFKLPSGEKISYKSYGPGGAYPVIVLHGLIGSVVMQTMSDIPADFPMRFIHIARPGYGESDMFTLSSFADWAKKLEPILLYLNIEEFSVLAMAAGAPYAYALGAIYPDRVKNLYILAGIPALFKDDIMKTYPKDSEKVYEFFRESDLKTIGDQIRKIYITPMPDTLKKSIEVKDSLKNNCGGMAQDTKLQSINWGIDFADIKANVKLYHSKIDNEVPFKAAEKMLKLLPKGKLISFGEESHMSEKLLMTAMDDLVDDFEE